MAPTNNTLAVVPPLLTVRVLLDDTDIPVKGLFIAFKLKPPKKEEGEDKKKEEEKPEAAKIARLVETLREKDLEKIRESVPAKKRSKAWEAWFAKVKAQYEAQLAETVADPADQFVLGITDVDGYLEPVYESSNPWRDRAARLEPDSFKFALGETYHALYIRHPSPDLARSLTRALNGKAPGRPDVDFKNTKLWGEPGPALQSFTVESGSLEDGEQFIIRVPAHPRAYVPRRTDDPNLWWLYAGMPHQSLGSIRDQLDDLITRLGQLKFPATASQDYPYAEMAWLRRELAKLKDEKGNRLEPVAGFHGTLHAAAARFQELLEGNAAFKPVELNISVTRTSWASHIGEVVKIDPDPVPRMEQGGVIGPVTDAKINEWLKNGWIKPDEHLVSVGFDPPPGVPMTRYEVLMLARGAFAFNAWGTLAKALGGCYGVNSGHSYRSLTAEGGGGAIKNSVHKTGLAIDLTGGRRRSSLPTWPVRFEAEFRRVKQKVTLPELKAKLAKKEEALQTAIDRKEKDRADATEKLREAKEARELLNAQPADPKKKPTKGQIQTADAKVKAAQARLDGIDKQHKSAIDAATKDRNTAQENVNAMEEAIRNDSDRLPSRWSMRFRLYGHSYADVFAKDKEKRAAARAALKPAIARWAGIGYSTDAQSTADDPDGGAFFQFVAETYFFGVPQALVKPWFDTQFRPARAFAQKLLSLSEDEIIRQLFRETITQWRVNFYERDGGSDYAKPWSPHEGDADFPAWPTAKSWINLSAIAHGCQLHRIPPHSMDSRDKLSFAEDKAKLPPMHFPMEQYLKFEASKAEQGDIVAAIEDITASLENAPQLAHKNFVIQFGYPNGNKQLNLDVEALPSEVDTEFFKTWRKKIFAFTPKNWKAPQPLHTPNSEGVYNPRGACVSIQLNPDRIAILKPALDLFSETFKAKDFYILESGKQIQAELPMGSLLSGADLRKAADKALKRLADEATAAKQKAEKDAADEAKRIEAEKEAARLAKKKYIPTKKAAISKPAPVKVEEWSLLIQPVFSLPPKAPLFGLGPKPARKMLFLAGHSVLLPPRENAAHLEWWHYQHHSVKVAGHWRVILEECGFSSLVMGTPAEGTLRPSGEPVHIGLGYDTASFCRTHNVQESQLDSHPWPSVAEIDTQPPNWDTSQEEAIEDDPDNVIE